MSGTTGLRRIDNLLIAPEHYKGAMNELKAQAWYLNENYQVFTPVTQQGVIDFIACKDDILLKVQVKTATWNKSGPYKYLQCRTRLTNKYQDYFISDLYDILFIIDKDDCWIIPTNEIDSSNISLSTTNPEPRREYKWNQFRRKI